MLFLKDVQKVAKKNNLGEYYNICVSKIVALNNSNFNLHNWT